eukprot:scaffold3337_cov169-Amphora_coffeaeformis.AAC.38
MYFSTDVVCRPLGPSPNFARHFIYTGFTFTQISTEPEPGHTWQHSDDGNGSTRNTQVLPLESINHSINITLRCHRFLLGFSILI